MHLFHLQNHIVSYVWSLLRLCSVIFGIDVSSNFFIYYPPASFIKKEGGCEDYHKPLQTVSFSKVNVTAGVEAKYGHGCHKFTF